MAKKMSGADAARGGVTSADLKRVIEDINRHKENASEHAGLAGKATQQAVERFGLEKTALTFNARLSRMEAAKRQGILRSQIDYADKLGFFDEIDAFDDLIDVLEGIVRKARAREDKPGAIDPAVAAMTH